MLFDGIVLVLVRTVLVIFRPDDGAGACTAAPAAAADAAAAAAAAALVASVASRAAA